MRIRMISAQPCCPDFLLQMVIPRVALPLSALAESEHTVQLLGCTSRSAAPVVLGERMGRPVGPCFLPKHSLASARRFLQTSV